MGTPGSAFCEPSDHDHVSAGVVGVLAPGSVNSPRVRLSRNTAGNHHIRRRADCPPTDNRPLRRVRVSCPLHTKRWFEPVTCQKSHYRLLKVAMSVGLSHEVVPRVVVGKKLAHRMRDWLPTSPLSTDRSVATGHSVARTTKAALNPTGRQHSGQFWVGTNFATARPEPSTCNSARRLPEVRRQRETQQPGTGGIAQGSAQGEYHGRLVPRADSYHS
jgi:hypothetical protein